jgi:hypothetical protein
MLTGGGSPACGNQLEIIKGRTGGVKLPCSNRVKEIYEISIRKCPWTELLDLPPILGVYNDAPSFRCLDESLER